jgi:hypothetical protein
MSHDAAQLTATSMPLGQVLGRTLKMPELPASARYLRVVVNEPGQLKGRGRNVSCPCGSGKKAKRCCRGRKPRTTTVTIDRGASPVDGVKIDRNGDVSFVLGDQKVNPDAAWLETSYPREKGAKILHKMAVKEGALNIIPDYALRGYDLLLAVDTGTRQVGTERVSVAVVVQCKFVLVDEQTWVAQIDLVPSFEFWNAPGNPEIIAWRVVVDGALRGPTYRRVSRVGIVVDSELSALADYNRGARALDGHFHLPDNIELIYASDKGEGLANRMLRHCDREATALLNAIEARPTPPPVAASHRYTHFRVWTPGLGRFPKAVSDGTLLVPCVRPAYRPVC